MQITKITNKARLIRFKYSWNNGKGIIYGIHNLTYRNVYDNIEYQLLIR